MLTDDLVRRVSLETLGAGVPALDPTGAIDHVEGVVSDAIDEQAEAALGGLGVVSRPLLGAEEPGAADGGCDPVRDELEEPGVVRREAARGQAADVEDADPAAVEHQRGAEQGVESLGPEDRADHLRRLTSSMTIVSPRAAIVPAIPRPNGIRMSSRTSSSRPWAARTASSVPSSFRRRMTTVSAASASRTRPRSSGRRSSRRRCVSAVSVTRCTARI